MVKDVENDVGKYCMPKISITISDYTYWKLLGSGESASFIVQKALQDYWKEEQSKSPSEELISV